MTKSSPITSASVTLTPLTQIAWDYLKAADCIFATPARV